MDDKERLEIAMKIVEDDVKRELNFNRDYKREIPKVAKRLGVSPEKLRAFFRPVIEKITKEMLESF